MEGTKCRWGYQVPVVHGDGVPGVCLQVLPVYHAGDVSDDCLQWGKVVECMAEIVGGVGVSVRVSGAYRGGSHECGGGVVGWSGNGGRVRSVGADVLEVED